MNKEERVTIKTVKRNDTVIGSCSMDNIEEFNEVFSGLAYKYGRKNVWFDRCYISRSIIFLTHG